MPLYDYDCANCGKRFEVLRGVHAAEPAECPLCGGGPIKKAFSAPAIHFKGSGWAKKERRASVSRSPSKSGSDDDSSGKDRGSSGKDRGSSDKDGGSSGTDGAATDGGATSGTADTDGAASSSRSAETSKPGHKASGSGTGSDASSAKATKAD